MSGEMLAALEVQMTSLVGELQSKMEADLAETTASVDLLRHDHCGGWKC